VQRGLFYDRLTVKIRTLCALRPVGEGLIDVKPLISASLPFDAFELASARSKSMKVHLTF